jgi:hypothetical protein
VEGDRRTSSVRLAELVAAFSLATDLGLGQPREHVLRSWLIAARVGERLGLEAGGRESLYYVVTGPTSVPGRLAADAVDAVLAAAGLHRAKRRSGPAGLTEREVEVLVLIARGRVQQAGRPGPWHHRQDRQHPHRAHLHQDRRVDSLQPVDL